MDNTKNEFNFSLSLSRAQQSSLEKQFNGLASVKKMRKGFSIIVNEARFSSEIELNTFRGALAVLKASCKKKIDMTHTNAIKSGLKLGALSLATGVVTGPIMGMLGLGALLTAGTPIAEALQVVGWIVGSSVLATTVIVSSISVFFYISEKNKIQEQLLLEMSALNPKSVPSSANRCADVNCSGNVLKHSQSEKNLSLLPSKVINYGTMFRSVSDSVLSQSSANIASNALKRF